MNKEIINIANGLEDMAIRLESKADAFWYTGNEKMSEYLRRESCLCHEDASKLRTIYSEDIDASWKEAQQSSANVLKAALAGVKLGQKSKASKERK